MVHASLKIGDNITCLPIIHGSGDFALEVRRVMLEERFDSVAVPLPPSFQEDVERAIEHLPRPTVVVQRAFSKFPTEWKPNQDDEAEDDDAPTRCSYVPIDPCQGVIAALRVAAGEHLPRHFIDLETARYEPYSDV